MTVQLAKAYPKKSFFINMFTKDITLEDCILDLVDNSIDGLLRTQKTKLSDISKSIFSKRSKTKPLSSLPLIDITLSQKHIIIKDNCGGISWKYAMEEAFNFGHTPGAKRGYLGVYGIGLKRALFKIGNHFLIESKTSTTGFKCDLDVKEWLKKDDTLEDWKIELTKTVSARTSKSAGTKITIDQLHNEVKLRLRDNTFITTLFKGVERTYAFLLGTYVRVQINGQEVTPFKVKVTEPKHGSISYEEIDRDNVKVKIIATIAQPSGTIKWTTERAGWYVVCNGRVVLSADKTEKTGWNVKPMPQFHNKFTRFIGFVFFESKDPLLLPWTTTKRNLNQESAIYQYTKTRMAGAARPIITYCNKKYPSDPDTTKVEREIGNEVKESNLKSLVKRRSLLFNVEPTKVACKTTQRLAYDVKLSDLDRIKKHLRKPSMTNPKIGKHTFDYFLKQEGLK